MHLKKEPILLILFVFETITNTIFTLYVFVVLNLRSICIIHVRRIVFKDFQMHLALKQLSLSVYCFQNQ